MNAGRYRGRIVPLGWAGSLRRDGCKKAPSEMSCDQLNIRDADDRTSGKVRRRTSRSWAASFLGPNNEGIIGLWRVAAQECLTGWGAVVPWDQADMTQTLDYWTL
jgi:hypothetical protein